MPVFFTVDRLKTLHQGSVLRLTRHTDLEPPEAQEHADALFPDGVSTHGNSYLLSGNSDPKLASPAVELLFEYVRRASFPEKPSRFQSLFAWESIEEAIAFRGKHGGPDAPIWRVEAEEFCKADMSYLKRGTSILVWSCFAHSYWRGEGTESPAWEILLVPPVSVLNRA